MNKTIINYVEFIKNKEFEKLDRINIDILFIPKGDYIFERHNYFSNITIFDGDLKDFFDRKFINSYEYDNPIARCNHFYLRDDTGDYIYQNVRYKEISDLNINTEGIPIYAFTNYNFNEVNIQKCKKIENCAFYKSSVNKFSIDDNIEYIGYNALPHNLNIKSGYFDIEGNEELILAQIKKGDKPKISDKTKIIYQNASRDNDMIKELIIPEGVTMIGSCAFSNCRNLKVVVLPKTLKYIEERAFYDTEIERLYYNGTKDDYDKIIINDLDWDYMEWLSRPIELGSNPKKEGTRFFVYSENAKTPFKGRKYLEIK